MLIQGQKIAIVGATGAVGREMMALLGDRGFPRSDLCLFASERSAGKSLVYRGNEIDVLPASPEAFQGLDIALFCASSGVARDLASRAVDVGCVVIDNSSAFRSDPAIPLIVPEVNGDLVRGNAEPRIIANPNCSTILLLVPLAPIHRAFGIDRVVVSTYQAVSGAGAPAMDELERATRAELADEPFQPEVFGETCAFNVFSHDSAVEIDTGWNVEERKMIDETHKIMDDDTIKLLATCIRVPVMRAHAESVVVTLREPATEESFREALALAPGLVVVDDRDANDFPTSLKATGRDAVLVGRIRLDPSQPSEGTGSDALHTGFAFFLAGDQIRKGAALNALQIAELVLE